MTTHNSVHRRGFLLSTALGGAAAAIPHGATAASAADAEDKVDLTQQYNFYGNAEQAGIRTPPQRHIFFMTFDLTSTQRRDLQVLLARWSAAIAQLVKGETIGQVEPDRAEASGLDTGEALNLGPASLTVTVGLGPNVFSDTYGLTAQKPALLRELRQLPSDALRPGLTGGDLSLHACADNHQ